MQFRLLFSLLMVLGAVSPPPTAAQPATGTLSGTVVGAGGEPLPWAAVTVHAVAGSRAGRALAGTQVGADGAYQLGLPTGVPVRVTVEGALQRGYDVTLLAEPGRRVRLDVQLGHLPLDDDQSYTRIVGSFNDFDYETGVPVDPVGPDAYAAFVTVATDSFAYEPMAATSGAFRGRVLAGLTADAWAGPLRPVVAAPQGVAKLVMQAATIDSAAFVRPSGTFGPANEQERVFARFYEGLWRALGWSSGYEEQMHEAMREAARTQDFSAVSRLQRAIERAEQDSLIARVEGAETAYARRLALLQLLHHSGGRGSTIPEFEVRYNGYQPLPSTYVEEILALVPPDSPLWTIEPGWVGVLAEQADLAPEAVAYAQRVAAEHASERVADQVLYDLARVAFARQGRSPEAGTLAQGYLDRFGDADNHRAQELGRLFEPSPLQEGAEVAPFRLYDPATRTRYVHAPADASAGAAAERASGMPRRPATEALAGRVVLLDVGRQAQEAVSAEQALAELAKDHADEGLAVVRVVLTTMDEEEFVATVPAGGEPVVHAYVRAGFMHPSLRALGVDEAPARIVIGRDGIVRAVGPDLTGERLREVVAAALRE